MLQQPSPRDRYYGLKEPPFSDRWDPKFFFKSHSHESALKDVLAAIQRRDGLIVLSGDAGTGKTTLCRALHDALQRQPFARLPSLSTPSREDARKALLVSFGVVPAGEIQSGALKDATELELSSRLYEFLELHDTQRPPVVLVIDEVQSPVAALFEDISTFTDLEAGKSALQLVLVGQPAVRNELTPDLLKQIGQRITVSSELVPLTAEEVAGYVRHRLAAAGGLFERIRFSNDALELVAGRSGGIPRAINEICDKALERGFQARAAEISRKIVADVLGGGDPAPAQEIPAPAPPPVFIPKPATVAPKPKPAPVVAAPVVSVPVVPAPAPDASGLDWDFEIEAAPLDDPMLASVGQTIPSPAPIFETPSFGDRIRQVPWRGVLVKMLAAAGVLIFAASVWLWMQTPSVPASAATQVAAAPIAKPVLKPPVAAPTQAALAPAPAPAPPPPTPPPAVATSAVAKSGVTYIIEVATFRRPEGAAMLMQELKSLGLPAYDVQVTSARGAMRRVLMGPFTAAADAESALKRVHQMPDYADARMRRVTRD